LLQFVRHGQGRRPACQVAGQGIAHGACFQLATVGPAVVRSEIDSKCIGQTLRPGTHGTARFIIDADLVTELGTAPNHGVAKAAPVVGVFLLSGGRVRQVDVGAIVDLVITTHLATQSTSAFGELASNPEAVCDLPVRANAGTVVEITIPVRSTVP